MNVQVEVLEHNMAKLTITVPAETFNKSITAAYKEMKNQISVPGFRKGKVPQAMVEKMYGPDMFYEKAVNKTIPEAYDEALAEIKDIIITSQPKIDLVQVGKGQEFIFTAEVATKPEATLGEYKGLEVEVEPVVVTDEEIDEEIKKVQDQNAREISVERPAENGDTVVIDFAGTVDGVAFDGGTAEGHSLVLGSGSFIPGFEEQLVGAAAGAEVNVNVTFPEDYQAEELAGKAAVFACKVNEVKVKEVPELNDDFAQDVSEFDTLDAYKADVKKNIEEKKQKDALQVKRQKVVDQIIEGAEMDIPDPMVETQARQMMDQYGRQLQQSGISLDMYFQYTGMTEEGLLEQLKPQALKNIQSRIVLEAVAKTEGFEITEEELDAEFGRMAETYGMEVEKIKELMGEVDVETIKSDLLAEKALKLVGDEAVEVPVKETAEEASDAE